MRADEASWPYGNPGGDEPDWAAGEGHPSWPAEGNGQNWTAGDDSWPANGNPQDWTAGDDSWPAGGSAQDWPRADGGPAAPGREPAAAMHHDPRVPTAPPPPAAGRVRVPAGGPGPGGAPQRSGPRDAAGPGG